MRAAEIDRSLRPVRCVCALCAVSGVLVPLPSSSLRRDTSELTLGEHKFALVHVRAGGAGGGGGAHAASSAAVSGYLRSGGQVFPAIALPLEQEAGRGGSTAAAAAAHHADDEHEADEEERSRAQQHAAHRIVRPLVKQQSFQLYETSARAAAAQQQAPSSRAGAPQQQQQPSPIVSFIRSCQGLYSSVSSALTALPAQFVPYSAADATVAAGPAALTPAELLASQSVVRAMAAHPTLPQIALLVRDQVHCYDVYGSGSAAAAAAGIMGSGAASSSAQSAALASSLGLDRAALVPGSWVPRTLRHPLMARACSVAFAAPGGNLLAVGTELGVLCLWQLVSVPAAASGHASSAAGAGAAAGASAGAGAAGSAAGSARRMGAWLHVLHHPSLRGLPLSHVSFSPCGRWLAVASRAASCFVVWNVSAALAGESNAAVPVQKLFGSLLEAQHGVDVLQWSAAGDRLLVATHQRRSKKLTLASLANAGVQASKRLWALAAGSSGASKGRGAKRTLHVDPEEDDDAPSSTSAAAVKGSDSLPGGTLTVWNTWNWSHQSWATSAPLSAAAWALPANAMQPAQAAAPTLLLVALQGSSVIQSLHLPALASSVLVRGGGGGGGGGVASSSSSLANASVRVDCRPVDGLPPSRQPSDPDAPLPRYLVGGAVRAMAWSAGGARLAVAFEDPSAAAAAAAAAGSAAGVGAEQEGSPELVALFALNRDRTDTFQVLPVGMIRGPGCDCGGRVHRDAAQRASSSAVRTVSKKARSESGAGSKQSAAAESAEDALEHKYDEPASSSAAESSVYPDLHSDSSTALVCGARNVPVHLAFLHTHSPAGELLAISWKFGQTTFVPMYFAK